MSWCRRRATTCTVYLFVYLVSLAGPSSLPTGSVRYVDAGEIEEWDSEEERRAAKAARRAAKKAGRVGDSPIFGAGTYASNDSCAVSCTGAGENFIKEAAAHSVAGRMRWGGASLADAWVGFSWRRLMVMNE